MQVSEVMTPASVTESPEEPVQAAAARMWEQQTGSLLVMSGTTLQGIITERDVMKAIARSLDLTGTAVREVMSTDVATVEPTTSLHDAARLMASRWIRHLPVVSADGAVVGMLSQRDLVGIFAALDSDPAGVTLDNEQLVRERRLVRIEQGDLD